jgi:ANTAR domain
MNPDHAHPTSADLRATDPSPTVARPVGELESMPVIEQAKGIIMAKTGRTEAEALDMLQQVSQRRNVPVRDLAVWLIASAVRHPRPAARPGHADQRSPLAR